MSTVPTTYFSEHIRLSQAAIGTSTDTVSMLARAQLEAAYRVLAANAEPLRAEPVWQLGAMPALPGAVEGAPCRTATTLIRGGNAG